MGATEVVVGHYRCFGCGGRVKMVVFRVIVSVGLRRIHGHVSSLFFSLSMGPTVVVVGRRGRRRLFGDGGRVRWWTHAVTLRTVVMLEKKEEIEKTYQRCLLSPSRHRWMLRSWSPAVIIVLL